MGSRAGLRGSQADSMGGLDNVMGRAAQPMGNAATPIGNAAHLIGHAVPLMGTVTLGAEGTRDLQQARATAGQERDEEEKHEAGCALATLQEAFTLPGGPAKDVVGFHRRRATTCFDSNMIAAQHMQADEPGRPSVMQSADTTPSTNQPSSLQQRIADYQKQHGLAALQQPDLKDMPDGSVEAMLGANNDEASPLKQRIAEYNAQHAAHEVSRDPSATVGSRFDSAHRTDLHT